MNRIQQNNCAPSIIQVSNASGTFNTTITYCDDFNADEFSYHPDGNPLIQGRESTTGRLINIDFGEKEVTVGVHNVNDISFLFYEVTIIDNLPVYNKNIEGTVTITAVTSSNISGSVNVKCQPTYGRHQSTINGEFDINI